MCSYHVHRHAQGQRLRRPLCRRRTRHGERDCTDVSRTETITDLAQRMGPKGTLAREESLEGIAKDNLDLSRALLACSLASGDCEPDFTREA